VWNLKEFKYEIVCHVLWVYLKIAYIVYIYRDVIYSLYQ